MAAAQPFKIYKLTDVNKDYFFQMSTDPQWVTGIESHTNVKLAADNEQEVPLYTVAELLRVNVAVRIKIAYIASNTRKYAQVLVSADQAANTPNLVGQGYGGGTIKRVIGKRVASFS